MEKVNVDRVVAVAVDIQNDFCPGGALGVNEGDQVVDPMNTALAYAKATKGTTVATRDWHPRETAHFAERGGPWPVHCVAGTPGAAFKEGLTPTDVVISKGTDPVDDGYSGFDGLTEGGATLAEIVRPKNGERVALVIGGLATDYCVKATVLDAAQLRNEVAGTANGELVVIALTDAMRAVDIEPGDGARSLEEMRNAGALMLTSAEVVNGALQVA